MQKGIVRDCITMCFDICTINIRVSIRVRGLHLVLMGRAWQFVGYHDCSRGYAAGLVRSTGFDGIQLAIRWDIIGIYWEQMGNNFISWSLESKKTVISIWISRGGEHDVCRNLGQTRDWAIELGWAGVDKASGG